MKKTLLKAVAYLGYLLLLAEICSRAYLSSSSGTGFFSPERLHYQRYTKLAAVEAALQLPAKSLGAAVKQDNYDVLLLGASALDPKWGAVEAELLVRLQQLLPDSDSKVRIHNVSEKAHTSLDSFYKYRHLRDFHFDLVILYHGINDVRMSYVPLAAFRPDYSHYAWYGTLNSYERYFRFPYFSLPYGAEIAWRDLKEKFGWQLVVAADLALVSTQAKSYPALTKQTALAFKHNVREILTLANAKNEPVVLLTFSYHLSENYSLEAFTNKQLDYGLHLSPVEIWGTPEAVTKGIDAHNLTLIELSQEYPEVIFVDLNSKMPKDKSHFNDICHLTTEGSAVFAQAVAEKLGPVRTQEAL